ncbi:MAG: molybdopterin cofactor-binding domain-containing protein [Geminicoccaceae bacterium]
MSDAHGRHVTHAELALDKDGNALALKVNTKANIGAYMSTFSSSIPTYLYATLLAGQYKTPAIYCDVQAYYTNTVPVDAYRGAGRPEGLVPARDPDGPGRARDPGGPGRFYRRNFIARTPSLPDAGCPGLRRGRLRVHLDKALEQTCSRRARKAEAARRGRLRGIGLLYIEAGIAPSAVVGSLGAGVGLWESAKVRFHPYRQGMQVMTGTHPRPGPQTTFVVAEKLGVPTRTSR